MFLNPLPSPHPQFPKIKQTPKFAREHIFPFIFSISWQLKQESQRSAKSLKKQMKESDILSLDSKVQNDLL